MQNAIATATEDQSAVIAKHDRLIRHLAARFVGRGVAFDDLMQEGRIALWLAVGRWRADGGANLWTYARRWVLASMMRCASEQIDETHDELVEEEVTASDDAEVTYLVRECLSMLSDEERAVVKLFMEGETFEQIAAVLKQSDRSVRRIFDGALTTLRERAS